MSSAPPELQPSIRRQNGCLVAVAVFLIVIFLGLALIYHEITGTAMPYRVFASMLQNANPSLKIDGIKGDLKSGFSVSTISWGDDPANRSEIRDLRLKYNGYKDVQQTQHLVIHELAVGKAHVELADFLPDSTTASATTSTSTSISPNANSPLPSSVANIEVQRVSIQDVILTNHATGFRLAVPKVEWTGFKATAASIDPGVLTIESDRLTLHTESGRTVTVEGQPVTFQKSLIGQFMPPSHPALKQPAAFVVDFSLEPGGKWRPLHIVAADGKLEFTATADGGGALHARKLNISAFLDQEKLLGANAPDLPDELVLSAVATSGFTEGKGSVRIVGGSFRLGKAMFQIEPLEFSRDEQVGAILRATARLPKGNVVWALPLANIGKEYRPHFLAGDEKPEEILSQVFTGHGYDDLSPDEKAAIDARKAVYFPVSP